MNCRQVCQASRLATVIILGLAYVLPVSADFLEMPSVGETPEPRTNSLLRDMDIPAVKFRNPDPTQGPRLAVSEFRVQGLVEYPEFGITREALSQLVERIRFDLMKEGKLLDSGYTLDELGELSDLLGEIEEEAIGRHVEPVDVQRLVWLIREQRGRRGITLGQIESVANTITQFYRERGFVLAKAYIPKQQVRDGIVNLTLLLGMLGDVKVHGNQLYKTKQLTSVFDDMMGKPVTNTLIEERLYLINDYPGIFVDGYFEPGYQVGDTRLGVNVKKESRFNANIRIDSHGTDETGLYRLYGDVQLNNPLGLADRLKVGILTASSPGNTDYWTAEYHIKPFGPRTILSVDMSQNQFLVDQSEEAIANLDLHGDVAVVGVTGTYLHRRTRKHNSTIALRFEEIESDLQLGNTPNDFLDDKLQNTSLMYDFDLLQEEARRYHQGKLKLTSGKFVYGAEIGQKENYHLLLAEYSLLNFWTIPFLNVNTRLITHAELQYAGMSLPGTLRYSLSGPTRARGYVPGLFTADDAYTVGVDWIFNSPSFFSFKITDTINFRDITKLVFFADYSNGRQLSLDDNERPLSVKLANIGLGLKFSHGKSFNGNLFLTRPVSQDFGILDPRPEFDDYRFVFDFQYSF